MSTTAPNNTWTTKQLQAEWDYLYNERLALLGTIGQPNQVEHEIAKREADAAILRVAGQQ